MKSETIKAIFTNVLFVIGVILLIFGFSRGLLTGVKLVIFDTYPLDMYQETRCELEMAPLPIEKTDGTTEPVTEAERSQRLQQCKESLEFQRKIKLTEDIVTSITTLISGGFLIYFFRRFILK